MRFNKRGEGNRLQLRTPGISFCLLLLFFSPANAGGIDLHALWDDRCAECHGHSADFAREFLKVSGGLLQGRHHVLDLHRFLEHHYPPANQVDALYQMLLAQTNTPPRFGAECGNCHGKAADFLRDSLLLKDGELKSRRSGKSVQQFMQSHRDMTRDDIQFYMSLFTRLSREIYRP